MWKTPFNPKESKEILLRELEKKHTILKTEYIYRPVLIKNIQNEKKV